MIIGVLALAPGVSNASMPSPTVLAAEQIVIPFAPPIGEDLHYVLKVERLGTEPKPVTTSRQRLRFSRAGGGYVLHFRTLDIRSNGAVIDVSTVDGIGRVPANLRPFLLPIDFDVASDGTINGVHDWPGWRAKIAGLADEASKSEPAATRASLRATLVEAMRVYTDLSAEQAPRALLKAWPDMLGYANQPVDADARYTFETEVPSPVGSVAVPVSGEYSVTRTGAGSFRFRQTQRSSSEKVDQAVAGHLDRMAKAAGDAAHRANIMKGVDLLRGMTSEQTVDLTFDPGTGMLRQGMIETRTTLKNGFAGIERLTLSRVP